MNILKMLSFNTVNGKDCCNNLSEYANTVKNQKGFNTVNGKDCCNVVPELSLLFGNSFNTVNGKDCCNPHHYQMHVVSYGETVSIP